MKIKNLVSTAVAAVVLLGSSAKADSTDTPASSLPAFLDQVYIGAGLGSALAYTDIKQYPTGPPVFKYRTEFGYGFNAFAGYKINTALSAEATLSWVRLNGTDRTSGEWFTSSVWQWDLGVRYNVANAFHKSSIETRQFDLYLLGGIGFSAFRTTRHLLQNGYSNDQIIFTQGYEPNGDKGRRAMSSSAFAGLGASYRLTENIDLNLDIKGYFLSTDLLDGLTSFNPTKDKYIYNTFGVIYHFGGAADMRSIDENDPEAKLDAILEKLKDTDGDGVADYVDKDNNTPAGVKVYADGTAVDTDGDGVADYLDQERVSPCKEVDANGVAKDGDTDGVADCNDIEPNTKAGAQVDSKGKTIASGPVGVSPVVTTDSDGGTTSAVISGLPSVFFALNSNTVSYKNYSALTQVAQFMKANTDAKLVVVGNSDKSGSASYNKVLGEKRAKSVVDYLVKRNGIDASRFTVQSKGSEEPISTKRNSGQDRRVDFLLGQ